MVVLGLATSHHDPKLQVRLHSNLDGSSLAHAIQVPMGPLRNLEVLPLFRWFSHTCSETSYRITDVECIVRAQTLQLNLTGEIG